MNTPKTKTALSRTWQAIRAIAQGRAVRVVVGGLALSLSFGYLAFLLVRNWNQLATYHWRIEWVQAALAFAYYTGTLACVVLGWSLIMQRVTGIYGWTKHLKYYAFTNIFRRLPIPWFYVAGRAVLYEREGVAKSTSTTLSLLEWVLIILSGLVVYLCTLPFQTVPSIWRSPWVLGGLLVVAALLVQPRTLQAVQRLLGRGESRISFTVWDILAWLALYSLAWVGGGLVTYAAITSIYALPIDQLPAVIGAWTLSGLVTTVLVAGALGLGVKEVTLTVLLTHLMPSPLAVVVALVTRVGLTLFELIWGGIALLGNHEWPRKR